MDDLKLVAKSSHADCVKLQHFHVGVVTVKHRPQFDVLIAKLLQVLILLGEKLFEFADRVSLIGNLSETKDQGERYEPLSPIQLCW